MTHCHIFGFKIELEVCMVKYILNVRSLLKVIPYKIIDELYTFETKVFKV